MYSELLMSQLPQLLLTEWTKNLERRILLYSILEVVLLMFHYWQSIMEFLKSLPLQEILILEEKILTKNWLNISLKFSKRRIVLIWKKTQELSKNLNLKLKKQREIFQVSIKSRLPLKVLSMELILKKQSLELNSKNFALIFLKKHLSQFNKFLMIQVWKKVKLMKLY